MMRLIRLLLIWLGLLGFTLSATSLAHAQSSPFPVSVSNVSVALKSARAAVAPGESFHVVIEQTIAPGWHTYWRNPGDSGEPTHVAWTALPPSVIAGPIKWPAPTAIPFGPLVNYGFSNRVVLPIEIVVPKTAIIGSTMSLEAQVRWLECADICIPGDATLNVDVKVAATGQDSGDAAMVSAALAQLPTPFTGTVLLTDLGAIGLQLTVNSADTPKDAYFFAHEIKIGAVVDSAQPQELVRRKGGFGLTLAKSPSFPTNLKGPVSGVLVLGKGASATAFVVEMPFEATPAGTKTTTPNTKINTQPPATIGLWLALIMALTGGLILNLMPCVFPILSMKALSLMEASHGDVKAARAHGLWYGAGVVVSFLALAGVLIALQSAGVAVGWGFQLQNPAIVLCLAILMVLIGFNLLGFFDVGASVMNIGSDSGQTKGVWGSFLTGALAVIVAAPCTAPFMGAALGFAATQPPLMALLVFGALGIGFALPFVVLTFSPGLLRALPKPGIWMVRLREGLAFPMFATAIWLIWVASAQAGQAGVLAGLVSVFGIALAVWIARNWPTGLGKLSAIVIALASVGWSLLHVLAAPPQNQSTSQSNAWSDARVAQLQSEGKTVFVNFTADWCVTCKVNEVSVFANDDVSAALSGQKATYLVADWTNRDDTIAKALARHGRIGVPLYLVYKPGQAQPVILPQILTARSVLDAVNR